MKNLSRERKRKGRVDVYILGPSSYYRCLVYIEGQKKIDHKNRRERIEYSVI
jgi:hypothetical protein